MFFRFVAKEYVSRKEVERNGGEYLDCGVFKCNFAPEIRFILALI